MKNPTNKQRKIQAIKDLASGKGLPPLEGPVIELDDGRYRLRRMGKVYYYTQEEFDKLEFSHGVIILPDNNR